MRKNKMISKNKWCPDSESNQGHEDFQSSALPTELSGQTLFVIKLSSSDGFFLRGRMVLNKSWWAIRDSNPGPAGYEPDALTN